MVESFHLETELKTLLGQGFISRKQYREILSSRPHSFDELKRILIDREYLDRPDFLQAEKIIGNPPEQESGPLSPGTRSPDMAKLQEIASRVAHTDTTVLILGESGVGKTRLARQIHLMSPRRRGAFVTVSCGSIPETMLESELFGVEKGAYTGALRSREGRFLNAHGGTIFLDEIGELTPALQVKLLRAIQEKKIQPLGSGQEIDVDVRLVAATNRDLEKDVQTGRFRQDLYFRLNVVSVTILPLRERREDIIPLAMYFLRKLREKDRVNYRISDPDVIGILKSYSWPGNIRELENCMERVAVLSRSGMINPNDFPPRILSDVDYIPGVPSPAIKHDYSIAQDVDELVSFDPEGEDTLQNDSPHSSEPVEIPVTSLKAMEERLIRRSLGQTGGNINQAASLLDIHRNTLSRKMEELGIYAKDYRKK